MQLSDWIGVGSIVAGVASAITFSACFLHFHDKLKTPEGRTNLISDMKSKTLIDIYLLLIKNALYLLKKWTGGPFSFGSIGVLIAFSVAYVSISGFISWGFGHNDEIGGIPLFHRPWWAIDTIPNHWIMGASLFAVFALSGLAYAMHSWGEQSRTKFILPEFQSKLRTKRIVIGIYFTLFAIFPFQIYFSFSENIGLISSLYFSVYLICLLGGISTSNWPVNVRFCGFAYVSFVTILSILYLEIGAITESIIIALVYWTAFPLINTASDYLSLGFSHWFGRKIVDDPSHSISRASLYGLADLGLALAFMVIAAATIPMALALLQWATGVDLGVRAFVTDAAADPWGAGLWFGIMILSTLVWTGLHLLITLGAMLFRLYDTLPFDQRVADMIEAGKDSVLVKLYLSSKWLIVTLIWCGLVYVFFKALDGATHVIATLFGSDKGLVGALETVALWGADLVPLPTEFRDLRPN